MTVYIVEDNSGYDGEQKIVSVCSARILAEKAVLDKIKEVEDACGIKIDPAFTTRYSDCSRWEERIKGLRFGSGYWIAISEHKVLGA
jgi:hypothetical protein